MKEKNETKRRAAMKKFESKSNLDKNCISFLNLRLRNRSFVCRMERFLLSSFQRTSKRNLLLFFSFLFLYFFYLKIFHVSFFFPFPLTLPPPTHTLPFIRRNDEKIYLFISEIFLRVNCNRKKGNKNKKKKNQN